MRRKKSFKFLSIIAVLLILLASVFFAYVNSYYKAEVLAVDSLKSDSIVYVEDNEDIIFKPVSNVKNTGFIFYPGAKVEASAYAPMAKEIASKQSDKRVAKALVDRYTQILAKAKEKV